MDDTLIYTIRFLFKKTNDIFRGIANNLTFSFKAAIILFLIVIEPFRKHDTDIIRRLSASNPMALILSILRKSRNKRVFSLVTVPVKSGSIRGREKSLSLLILGAQEG